MKTQYSDLSRIHTLERACSLYNRLTNPAIPRSDFEWAVYRKATRKVKAFLAFKFYGQFGESESGRMYPY